MAYFLGALLLACSGFVFVLARLEMSPKAALRKLLDRFYGSQTNGRAPNQCGPYSRVRNTAGNVHKPVLLNLATSDGSGQACHPDVVHIPGGFGVKNWTYWMACTPYPYGDFRYENPEVFVSYDGLHWTVPDGLRNPLVQKPGNAIDHNSDPDIVYHGNELWLFYRETLRSKIPAENRIYVMKSADGVRWSRPVEVLSEKTGEQLLSPAVLHDGNSFRMWTVEVHGGKLKLMHRRSTDGMSWSGPPEATNITGMEKGRHPWHIDVIQEAGGLSAVLVSCTKFGGSGSRIHYAHSDDGLEWFAEPFMFDQVYEFEASLQYRGSLRKVDDGKEEYELWYSAASLLDVFSVAYLKLTRKENRLFPSEPEPLRSETLTALK